MKRPRRSFVKKSPALKKRCSLNVSPATGRPHHRIEIIVGFDREGCERADIEVALPLVFEGGETSVFAKNVGWTAVRECGSKTKTSRHLADDPPIGLRLAWTRQERALSRDAPFGVGDGPILLAPRCGRQQHLRTGLNGVVADDVFGDDEQLEPLQGGAHRAGARQRHARIGRHHPQCLDRSAFDGLKHIDGFQPFAGRHAGRVPEAADAAYFGGREAHVGGELVGEPADLAPAHGVGLAGERKRPHADSANAACGQMHVDDRIHLVGALGGLIDPLREGGDDATGVAKKFKEARNIGPVESCGLGGSRCIAGDFAGAGQRLDKTRRVPVDILVVESECVGEVHEQTAEQRGIHARRDRKEQIGVFDRRGSPRIDDDQFRASFPLGGDHPLIEDGMTPRRIRADQHDEIGLIEIAVCPWDDVGAKGATVAGD